MKKHFIFLMLLFFNGIVYQVKSQDISGVWKGNYSKVFLGANPEKIIVEMKLLHDSIITSSSHLYYKKGKFENHTINGIYRKSDSAIYLKEDAVISINLPELADVCPGNYKMHLLITDSSFRLEGIWEDNDRSFMHCPSRKVYLEKLNPVKTKKKQINPTD